MVTPFVQTKIHHIIHEDYLHLKAQAKVLVSSKHLGSDHDFGIIDLSGETSTQWGLMWLTRWHVSEIMYYKEFSTLPANIKLATGGADLIRGFDYQSIGFGDKLFEASLEARYLINSFYVSAFLMLVWPAWNGPQSPNSPVVSVWGMTLERPVSALTWLILSTTAIIQNYI